MMCRASGLAAVIICMATLPLWVGCTNTPVSLGTADHEKLLQQDQSEFSQYNNQRIEITLPQALERAISVNLDARVAAMELIAQKKTVSLKELEALPSLNSSRGIFHRSNNGASSSRSVLSGLESLEPSQSSDEKRFVSELKASWNLMDAGIALAEADRMKDETSVVDQRYKKIIQNIERDVYIAYWRSWVYQHTTKQTNALLSNARSHIGNIVEANKKGLLSSEDSGNKAADIANRMRALQEVNAPLSLAETELKTLLSYPQSARLKLKKPDEQISKVTDLLQEDVQQQEWTALKSRPEMKEEILQKNIAIKNIHHEILKTFPGADLMFSYNNDSNSFLQDGEWSNFSVSIVQNILNVFTLPARFDAARKKEKLSDARRQALGAAIVAQVNLGRIRLNETLRQYKDSQNAVWAAQKKSSARTQQNKIGFSSGGDAMAMKLESHTETIRNLTAMTEMQDAYAALINTLGQEIQRGRNDR